MADTTLKAYYAYLDELLTRRKYDEVVAHGQHILEKYPKNLGVLRRLGKAQLESGQYDDALKSYTRVLSYAPQEVDAYVGLSWVSRQRSQGDNAIYYLERAYERDSSNAEVIGLLREAYRLFHDRANAKLPNTPYMVARQQVRSGLSSQAVKTLQDALAEQPKRTDLRLLLTDIYAQIGQATEAAKSAAQVLKELPDCLRANQLLATIWLSVGRPSDAQRLVASMEDIDPYLAYEVAVGNPATDDAFIVSMFDYEAGVSASTSATPEWMNDLGDLVPKPQPHATAYQQTAILSEPEAVKDDAASWLDMLSPTEDAPVTTSAQPNDMSWLPETDTVSQAESIRHQTEEWVKKIDPTAMPPSAEADQNDWLSATAPAAPPPAEDNDWLAQLGGSVTAELPNDAPTDEPQSQWLQDLDDAFGARTVVQRTDFDFAQYRNEHPPAVASTPPVVPVSTPHDVPPAHNSTGLTGLLSILSGETPATDDLFAEPIEGSSPLFTASDDPSDDSQIWMEDNATDGDTPILGASDAISDDNEDVDPFAWMQEHDIEIIEPSTEVEDFLSDGLGVVQMGSLDQANEDSLAWARSSGVEVSDIMGDTELDINPEDDPFAWLRQSGVEIVNEDEPVLLTSPQAHLLNETPDVGAVFEESESDAWGVVPQDNEVSQTDSPPIGMSSHSGMTGLLAFMGSDVPADNSGGAMGDTNDIPDWLKASSTDDEPEATAGDALPDAGLDWLSAVQPTDAPSTEADDDINWETDGHADDEDADESVPDWMAALEDSRDAHELSNVSTVESPMVTGELTVDEAESGLFDTLMVDGTFADDNLLDGDVPLDGEAVLDEDAPSWLMSEPPSTVAVRPAEPEAPMPSVTFDPHDDLLLVAPSVAETVDAPPALSEDIQPIVGDIQALVDETPAVVSEVPDVLTESADESDDSADDWLTAMAVNAPSAAVSPELDLDAIAPLNDDFGFDAEPPSAAVSDDELDFGSFGFSRDADVSAPIDAPANADDGFNWLSDAAPSAPAATSPAFDLNAEDEDGIDWLSDAAPSTPAATSPAFDLNAEDEEGIDWLSDAAPSAPAAAALAFDLNADDDGGLDWLNESAPEQDETKLLPKTDEFALSFFDDEQPSTELGASFFDSDPLTSRTTAADSFAFETEEPTMPMSVTGAIFNEIAEDDDLLMAEDEHVDFSETSAVSAPDWLNALAPGLEVDTDTAEFTPDSDYLGGGRGDYGWLNAIVEEETRPPVMVSKPRTARFPFTTPPAWLQTIREETQQVTPVDEFDIDADDDGLPDWLSDIDDSERN